MCAIIIAPGIIILPYLQQSMQAEADLKEDTPFSTNLYKFLSMQMQLWPSLQASLSHLSSLPHPYNSLSAAQLCTQLTDDYHKFIMTHDVDQ